MKLLISILLLLSASCNKISSSALMQDSGKDQVLNVKIDDSNSTLTTIPLDVNLPNQQIDFDITEAQCNTINGRFFKFEVNGEAPKNLCLTKDSIQSSGVFVRLLLNYVSILWGQFTFPTGSLDKNFKVRVKMGKYCAKPGLSTLCLNAYGGDASLGEDALLPLLELKSEILSSNVAKTTIKDILDLDPIKSELSKKLGGVELTDTYKTLISAAALSFIGAYLPQELNISIYDFKAEGQDEYSISADLFLPEEWIKNNKGEFDIPNVETIAPILKIDKNLANFIPRLRLLVNHDCNAMIGSVYGDYNACVAKGKTTLKATLKSTVLTDVTRGKYQEISIDSKKNSYESLALNFTNLGIGFVKDNAAGDKASCSWKAGEPYNCAFNIAINQFKYMDKANKVSLSFSSGTKTMLGKTPNGECTGRFMINPDMTKYERKNIPYIDLKPQGASTKLTRDFRVDVKCLKEIIGSCNCRGNGKIKFCGDDCANPGTTPPPKEHLPQPGDCFDEPPRGKSYSCGQQASWNKCSEKWMQGYCKKSCGTCEAGAEI